MANYLSIVESESVVAKLFLDELAIQLSAKIRNRKPAIERKIGNMVISFINDSVVFNAITSDHFRGLFGLTPSDAQSIQDQIRTIARDDFEIRVNRLKANSSGFSNPLIEIGMIESGSEKYRGIGEYTSSNNFQIPVMDWLLFQGDRVVVNDYQTRNVGNGRGRSGLGLLMVPGGLFRVPSEYSGTANTNLITKALSEKRKQVGKQIEQIIQVEIDR